jgi:Rrf2 family protein
MATNCRFAFAVHVLSVLATHPDEIVASDVLAKSANTNPVVIRRLLVELRDAGLVETTRGASGGTRLAKSPRKISLLEIHLAAAGKIEPFGSHPKQPKKACCVGREITRVLHGVSDRARRAIEKEYARISLAQVVQEMQHPSQ